MSPEEQIQQLREQLQELTERFNKFDKRDRYFFGRAIELGDMLKIVFPTLTGAFIGTAVTQKIGFWGVTPVVQPQTTGETTGASDVTINNTTTFTGNNGATAYTILDVVKALKNVGILKK